MEEDGEIAEYSSDAAAEVKSKVPTKKTVTPAKATPIKKNNKLSDATIVQIAKDKTAATKEVSNADPPNKSGAKPKKRKIEDITEDEDSMGTGTTRTDQGEGQLLGRGQRVRKPTIHADGMVPTPAEWSKPTRSSSSKQKPVARTTVIQGDTPAKTKKAKNKN